MKKIIILGVFFAFFVCLDVFAQSLTVTCNSIRINGVSSPNAVFIEQPNQTVIPNSDCRVFLGPLLREVTTTFFLDKVENGVTTRVATQQTPLFDNLQPGTYIASFSQPSRRVTAFCTEIQVINSLGQNAGIMVDIPIPTQLPAQSIGLTAPSDNQWSFKDGNGSSLSNILFDANEPIRLDASASKNFTHYFLAIFEYWPGNVPGRWRAKGDGGNGAWITQSQDPLDNQDMQALWNPSFSSGGWQFIPGNTYKVQVAISNAECPFWNEKLQSFFVCNANWGCRAGDEKAKSEPNIAPNPATNSFQISDMTFNPSVFTDVVEIRDISSRLIKSLKVDSNQFDISDVPKGMYFVSVIRDKYRILTKKLIVEK